MEDLCVVDLINQGEWDVDWLPIPADMKMKINEIRMPITNVSDKLMWSVSSKGKYSIKIGYLSLQEHKN